MANSVRIGASVDDGVSGPLDRIRDKFDAMGKGAASASLVGNLGAMALTKGVGLLGDAASKAVEFIGDSVKAASDLSESASKSKVIFGDAAGTMDKFGSTAATSLGISKRAALEAGATFGNFFTGVGQSQQAAAGMSKKLVTLASDLASFNNMDPTETLDKLRSGLTGEAEPLRSLGVFMTDAKMKAKAMEMGLADAHGELSEGAKVLARYQIILDETKTAQGDFARTSDGLANSQRITAAAQEDAMAKLGKAFEPVAQQLENAKLGFIKLATAGLDAMSALSGGVKDDSVELVAATNAMANDMGAGAAAVQAMAKKTADALAYHFDTGGDRAKIAMNDAMGTIEGRMRTTRDRLTDIAKDIVSDTFDPQINAAEIAATRLQLADDQKLASTKKYSELSKAEIRKMTDDQIDAAKEWTDRDRAEAELRVLNDQKSLASLLADQAGYQKDAGDSLTQHLAEQKGQLSQYNIDAATIATLNTWGKDWVHTAAIGISGGIDEVATAGNQIVQTMGSFNPNGYPIGASWTTEIAQGITSNDWKIGAAIRVIGSQMIGFSPPKAGPLKDIDKGGRNIAKAWVEAFAATLDNSGLDRALSRLAGVAAGAPDATQGGLSTAMAAVGSGGSPVEIPVYLDGREISRIVDRNLYYGRGARGLLPSG